MGERNCIYLVNDNIYLYSHWDDVESLKTIVKSALIRGRDRWSDRPYLNRIIFSEMIKDDIEGLLGFGLGGDDCGGSVVINIDVENNMVDEEDFEEFIK